MSAQNAYSPASSNTALSRKQREQNAYRTLKEHQRLQQRVLFLKIQQQQKEQMEAKQFHQESKTLNVSKIRNQSFVIRQQKRAQRMTDLQMRQAQIALIKANHDKAMQEARQRHREMVQGQFGELKNQSEQFAIKNQSLRQQIAESNQLKHGELYKSKMAMRQTYHELQQQRLDEFNALYNQDFQTVEEAEAYAAQDIENLKREEERLCSLLGERVTTDRRSWRSQENNRDGFQFAANKQANPQAGELETIPERDTEVDSDDKREPAQAGGERAVNPQARGQGRPRQSGQLPVIQQTKMQRK